MTFPQLSNLHRAWIRRIDWTVAALVAALIVVAHIVNMTHAGGLWRDEAAAVNLALMPSFGEIWSHLELESFPLLITMLLRVWSALSFGGSDLGLRVFGMLAGLAVLAALWWNAWRFSSSPPTLSMLIRGRRVHSPKLPSAGEGPEGWRGAPYMMAYGMEVAYFLQFHALEGAVLKAPLAQAVNPFENLPVKAVSGWRF